MPWFHTSILNVTVLPGVTVGFFAPFESTFLKAKSKTGTVQFCITVVVLVQLSALVTVTVAVTPELIPETTFPLIAPAVEVMVVPAGIVNVTEYVSPSAAQTGVPAVMVGVGLITTVAEPGVVLSHSGLPVSTHFTVYVPAAFTVIDVVVALVDHR